MSNNVEGFTNKKIINQEAAQWVLLLEDTPELSQKQIKELNEWVATSEVHRECLENMVTSWGEMDLLSSVMLPVEMRKPASASTFWASLLYPVLVVYAFIKACCKQSKYLTRPAFAVPVMLCTFTWLVAIYAPMEKNTEEMVFQTKMGESISHVMSDGSIIWLNSSSKINIDYSDDYRRINLVKGEAHFEVAKDPSRPFEVYANDRLVRAIGTAFTVHKLDGRIEVLVSEGTVELAIIDNTLVVTPDDYQEIKIEHDSSKKVDNTQSGGVVSHSKERSLSRVQKDTPQPFNTKKSLGTLTAGQRVSIPIKNDHISDVDELDTSEVTRFLSWKEGKLVFAGESLEEVIKEITRHTPIQIDVLDPQLKTMRIGGQFQVGETDTLFYVLESGFGISVKKLNAHHVQLRVKEKK